MQFNIFVWKDIMLKEDKKGRTEERTKVGRTLQTAGSH